MPSPSRTDSEFFEELYRSKPDPWNFAQSEYEQGRFEKIASALSHKRYHRAFEPGCSIGTLTEKLALLCDQVDASDFSETAVAHAKERCASLPHVTIFRAAFSDDTPLDSYDLVILSEIGYYFPREQWRAMVPKLAASMQAGTTVLASHWTGHSQDYWTEADEVHAVLRKEKLLQLEHEERHPGFRLDRFMRI